MQRTQTSAARKALVVVLMLIASSLSPPGTAQVVTPELQRAARNISFEVVLPKVESDALSYEKPLPLDLIPFAERNDKYFSYGTAFSIGPNEFATAAHVLVVGLTSQFGLPSIRATDGKIYEIDRVLRFSLHEDLAVVSVKNGPATTTPQFNRAPAIDSVVYAVGNALGAGVVIRGGIHTSATPEDDSGRWKWLRFSAAASPGNSGGPLLDDAGRVIGVVIGKSDNENLNFALPIANVLDAPKDKASFDVRLQRFLPNMKFTRNGRLAAEIPLPAALPQFAERYQELLSKYGKDERARLLAEHDAEIFPRGKGSGAIIDHVAAEGFPVLLHQDEDQRWVAEATKQIQVTDLGEQGSVELGNEAGLKLFRVRRTHGDTDPAFFTDSKKLLDLILRAEPLYRPVGTDSVRVTSLGAAAVETVVTDNWGRRWQLRRWPLGYGDAQVVVLALPLPYGYVGIIDIVPSSSVWDALDAMPIVANFITSSYGGTVAQWRQFLAEQTLQPAFLARVKLTQAGDGAFDIATPRFSVSIPSGVIARQERNYVELIPAFLHRGDGLSYDVGGAAVLVDPSQATMATVVRVSRPDAATAKDDVKADWNRMITGEPPYQGFAVQVPDNASKYRATVVRKPQVSGKDEPHFVYLIQHQVEGRILPWELQDKLQLVSRQLRILEQ